MVGAISLENSGLDALLSGERDERDERDEPVPAPGSAPPSRVLAGCLDVSRIGELIEIARAILDEPDAMVVLDCTRVEHLDGAAVQVLLALQRSLGERGRELTLRGLSAPVRRLLRLVGVERLFLCDDHAPGLPRNP